MSECKLDILGGQDAFPIFREAAKNVTGKAVGVGDDKIGSMFLQEVTRYTQGYQTKSEALERFKTNVEDTYGIKAE